MSSVADTSSQLSVELIRHRLEAAAREMAEVLRRSSYSPLIRESLDFSNTIHHPGGEIVAQYAGLPFLAGAMTSTVASMLERVPLEAMRPGDALFSNDPYLAGGTHIPDISVVVPVFHGQELVCFAQTKAHMLDVGGLVPGSWAADAADIYQEGIRIPHVKLVSEGRWDEDVLALVLANVRVPEQLRADLRAMLGACEIGARRVGEVVERFGAGSVAAASRRILDYAERRMRSRIAELPDGVYRATDTVEDDGTGETVELAVSVTVAGEEIVVDFEGSGPQVEGSNGNMIFGGAVASTCLTLRSVLDPHGPNNDGAYRPVTIRAPVGTCVNPTMPAPVTVGLASVAFCAISAIMRALAEAAPDRVMSDEFGNIQALILSGPVAGRSEPFIHIMVYPGGSGARKGADGFDGVVNMCDAGVRNIPTEIIESNFPLRVERVELRPDSAGPGRTRGGVGVRYDYRVLGDGVVGNTSLCRYAVAPRGLEGGGEAATSETIVTGADGRETAHTFGSFELARGDLVSHRTGGGGGYGRAAERPSAAVVADVRNGLVSVERARADYGTDWEIA